MYITCLFNLSSPGLSCRPFLGSYKSHKQDILQKHLQIDQSIFASHGRHTTNYFVSLGIFFPSGMQDAEVKKSLNSQFHKPRHIRCDQEGQQYYCVEGARGGRRKGSAKLLCYMYLDFMCSDSTGLL